MILTDDPRLNTALLDPQRGHHRTYLVQVEGIPDEEALKQLRAGVDIRINKKTYHTRPAQAELLSHPPVLPERNPPVRFRKTVPDRWLKLTLTEGKNRQVRRMCAAVGFPVLRLIRIRIEALELGDLLPGKVRKMDGQSIYKALTIRG